MNEKLLREAIVIVLAQFGVDKPELVAALTNVGMAWASVVIRGKMLPL